MTQRPPPYTAAVVQLGQDALSDMGTIPADMARNVGKIVRWIRFLCDGAIDPPRLIVFPIVSIVGSRHRPMPPTATPIRIDRPHDPVLQPIIDACAEFGCYVSTSVLTQLDGMGGRYTHCGVILSGDGVVLRQPKFQSYTGKDRDDIRALRAAYVDAFGAGALNQVIDTPIGRLGSVIDRDMLIPEVGRHRARAGAEVLVHPAFAWQDTPMPYVALRQAMAFQNSLFILSAVPGYERWNEPGGEVFHLSRGQSTLVDPMGEVLACCDQPTEGFALARIDLARIDAAKAAAGAVITPIWEQYQDLYDKPEP